MLIPMVGDMKSQSGSDQTDQYNLPMIELQKSRSFQTPETTEKARADFTRGSSGRSRVPVSSCSSSNPLEGTLIRHWSEELKIRAYSKLWLFHHWGSGLLNNKIGLYCIFTLTMFGNSGRFRHFEYPIPKLARPTLSDFGQIFHNSFGFDQNSDEVSQV